MTRGNQRDRDRAKSQKKAASQKRPKESGASLAKRKEADAAILRTKQQAKQGADADATKPMFTDPTPQS